MLVFSLLIMARGAFAIVACTILYGKKLTRCLCSLMFRVNNKKISHMIQGVYMHENSKVKMTQKMGYWFQS